MLYILFQLDYYTPEAYVPPDTYIEKESSINEQIDRCDTLPQDLY